MKRFSLLPLTFSLLAFGLSSTSVTAQETSCASFLRAQPKADVAVPFRITDEGKPTPIEWGLDLAWLSEENIRRGVNFAGKNLIDIVRTSYTASESVEEGALSTAQLKKINERATIIKKYLKKDVALNLNHDHGDDPQVDEWYNAQSAGSTGRGQRWAQLMDLAVKRYTQLGLKNFVSISPYNEPDFGWGQGYSNSTRKADFLAIARSLKNDFEGAYDSVRICGGNTLNDDKAYEWWNYLKSALDEGNTHQLAGDFDHYADFFKKVREYGHHATADELHNTMEAMVGVEYGMQTGIWWGTCEHSRSQFMKATGQAAPGRRLAYAEHRNNWTAAAVYRQTDGNVQAFGGTSERQAVATTYKFVSMDCPVWYNGVAGREYVMSLPGGTGYQKGQTNAETVVDVQSGEDVMPHIDGAYKIMNVNSGMLMGFSSNVTSGWVSTIQRRNGVQSYLQWLVKPMPETCGGDFSYYSITLNNEQQMVLDILNWNLDAGADVGAYKKGGMGTNEQWYLEYAGEGAFYIRSRFSAKCLEVKGGSKSVSANIQMGDFKGATYQQWRFLPVDVIPDLVAPAAPTGLEAQGQAGSVRLSWQSPADEDVKGYTILRSDDAQEYYAIATNVTSTIFTDNEAADGQTYSYKVYAIDQSLNYSEHSNTATAAVTGEETCIMHLDFENQLWDKSHQGNHAALYGDSTWTEGKVGQTAISLVGTDQFVQLPPTVANHEALTISCWVYWKGGSAWQRIWDLGNGTSQYMFLSPKTDGGMRFAIKDGGDEQQVRFSRALTMNTWVHLCLTLGNGVATLYMNGEEVSKNTSVSISPADFRPVMNYIGRSQFAADPSFNGYVDDFRVYNYQLSAEEVGQIASLTDGIAPLNAIDGKQQTKTLYDLSGRPLRQGSNGLVIEQGSKRIIK